MRSRFEGLRIWWLDGEKAAFSLISLCAAGVLARILTPHMFAATIAYSCFLIGLSHRKTPAIHGKWMSLGVAIDVAIVLVLEINRNAVATAFAFKLGPLQQIHIAASSMALLFYAPLVYLGLQRRKGKGTKGSGEWHRRLGWVAFAFRTIGFLFMFTLLVKHDGS